MAWGIIALLLLLILLDVPVGFALMISSSIVMLLVGIDLITVPIQIFSGSASIVLLAIPLFILMGELMSHTSISQRLIDLSNALVGWIRGGLSHTNVVTNMFMAEMSGSAVADAAVLSKIFVPSMIKQGYPAGFSAAVTSAAATLGIIIPPSIPMVLYGVTTNTSIKDLFIAGIVPGLVLTAAFMITNYIFAVKQQYPVDQHFEWPRLGAALKNGAIPLLIPLVVVGGLIFGWVTPTEAAAIGVVAALLFGFLSQEINARQFYQLLVITAEQTAVVMMIVAGSAVLGQLLANEQLPQKIIALLGGYIHYPTLLLIMINICLLLCGMLLHASAAIIIVVPLLAPLALQIGVDPVHFGVIVCLNLGIGQQTPPVASVLLTVCSVVNVKLYDAMVYLKWYILSMLIVLAIVTFVPELSLWFRD